MGSVVSKGVVRDFSFALAGSVTVFGFSTFLEWWLPGGGVVFPVSFFLGAGFSFWIPRGGRLFLYCREELLKKYIYIVHHINHYAMWTSPEIHE